MADLTLLLEQIEAGDEHATAKLLPLVYDELRKLAAARMEQERAGHTLQATALVHDAYLRLVDQDGTYKWTSRGHFFAAAAEAMRRILIDQARKKQSLKGGGEWQRVELGQVEAADGGKANVDILELDEALTRLAEIAPEKAKLVKLRFFAGLSIEEVAAAMDISVATAKRHWVFSRTWLYGELKSKVQ